MVVKTTPPVTLNAWIDAESSKVPRAYHGMRFAERGSPNYLQIHDAIQYAAAQGGILQSLPEAVVIRAENDGSIADANKYQITRTVPLYFIADGTFHVAVTDSPSVDENVLVARSAEAQKAFSGGRVWCLPSRDDLVKKMMKIAEKEGRIFALPQNRQPYKITLDMFDTDEVAKGFCHDVAPVQAAFLKEKGYGTGRFWLLNNGLSQIGENEVGVRPVGLGNLNLVDADVYFGGRSRPVVRQ